MLGAIAAELHAAMLADYPPIESKYAPDRLPEVREELAALEGELDVAWPGWRRREPFNHLDDEPMVFVKLRLKRIDLIRHGRSDWGMRVVRIPGRRPVVEPVRPPKRWVEVSAQIFDAPVSASILAEALGRDVADVEQAIASIRESGGRITRRGIKAALRDRQKGAA